MVIDTPTTHYSEMINTSTPVPYDTTDHANECKIEISLEVNHSIRLGFLDDSSDPAFFVPFPQMQAFNRISNSFMYLLDNPEEIQIATDICREDLELYGFDHHTAFDFAEEFNLKCNECVESHYEWMETNEKLRICLVLWVETVYDDDEYRLRIAISESSTENEFPICPASEEAIAALVKFRVAVAHHEYICSVCTEEFKKGDEVVPLQCTHWFHSDCIVPWLKNMNTCPNCRTNI